MTTLITERLFTPISWELRPTKLKTKTSSPESTLMEYRPSRSVAVPIMVPFTNTVTPGIGCPSSEEVTVPETVPCARKLKEVKTQKSPNSKRFIIPDPQGLAMISSLADQQLKLQFRMV